MAGADEPFVHENLKLSGNSIRLVELLPGGADDPIACCLSQYALHRRPPYAAVSYMWGSSDEPRKIRLNGKSFTVRQNLWSLLRHFRAKDRSIILWIDAICIDQTNIPERNFQVTLMGQIYERAESVMIWLGPAADNSDEAMDFLETMKEQTREDLNPIEFGRNFLSPKCYSQWTALLRLCERDYWKRTWIIQEVLLATRIEVHCGAWKVDWTAFDSPWVQDFQYILAARSSPPREAEAVLQSLPFRLGSRRKTLLQARPSSLEELLWNFRDSYCTDHRDKVFALLQLASDNSQDGAPVADYSKDRIEVLLDVLRFYRSRAVPDLLDLARLLLYILDANTSQFCKYIQNCIESCGISSLSDLVQPLGQQYITMERVGEITHTFVVSGDTQLRKTRVAKPLVTARAREEHGRSSSPEFTVDAQLDRAFGMLDSTPELKYLLSFDQSISRALQKYLWWTASQIAKLYGQISLPNGSPASESHLISVETNRGLLIGFACSSACERDVVLQFKDTDHCLVAHRYDARWEFVGTAAMTPNPELGDGGRRDRVTGKKLIFGSATTSISNRFSIDLNTLGVLEIAMRWLEPDMQKISELLISQSHREHPAVAND
jgi:hypothetical protein